MTGAPVDRRDLAVAALVGQIRHVAVDDTGRVIHYGRRQRFFTGAAREAVLFAFGKRCSWPGCEIESGHLHIDHLSPWAATLGPTDPTNGGPTCASHNHHKHHADTTVIR